MHSGQFYVVPQDEASETGVATEKLWLLRGPNFGSTALLAFMLQKGVMIFRKE